MLQSSPAIHAGFEIDRRFSQDSADFGKSNGFENAFAFDFHDGGEASEKIGEFTVERHGDIIP